MDNPELESREIQEPIPNSEIGAVEVEQDTPDKITDQTIQDLYELPNGLRIAFDRVAPGLGTEVYGRAQELAGDLVRQLQDSRERGNVTTYGSFNDNTTVSTERESMNFGQINTMVAALEILADQLADQARRQPEDEKVIDLDKLDGGEERAVPEFWYLLTGQKEFGSGHEVQVGPYILSTLQSQEAQGPGSETRKLVIRKTDKLPNGAESVVAAEEATAHEAEPKPDQPDNVKHVDFTRKEKAPRYDKLAEDSPREQNEAA